jgi:hypothetical protein
MKNKTIDRLILTGVLLFIVLPIAFTITCLGIDSHKANEKWKQTHQQVYSAAWYQCEAKRYPSWKNIASECYHWKKEFVICKCVFTTEERDLIQQEIVIYKDENGKWR